MYSSSQQTEQVVNQHLNAFIKGQGIQAIMADYHDYAIFITPEKVYKGKPGIQSFFETFIDALPDNARHNFNLYNFHVNNELAYIIWNVNNAVSLGTDTFIVRDGKITQQTFAMQTT